jgi:hypothetical protein
MKTLIVNYEHPSYKTAFMRENKEFIDTFSQVVYVNNLDANGVNISIVESE